VVQKSHRMHGWAPDPSSTLMPNIHTRI
jgi:hypothetical protein